MVDGRTAAAGNSRDQMQIGDFAFGRAVGIAVAGGIVRLTEVDVRLTSTSSASSSNSSCVL